MLEAEYGLLYIADKLKGEFDEHAKSCGVVNIPKFYFYFKDSFLGEFIFSGSMAHNWFIATPLLPCGVNDPKVRKFTGNVDLGEAKDQLTKAVQHTFAHFTAVYTEKNLVLCYLQGTLDNKGIMCLIDPQAHTLLQSRLNSTFYEFWDLGDVMIKKFFDDHCGSDEDACQSNWLCCPPEPSSTLVEKVDAIPLHQELSDDSSKTQGGKNNLNYITD